MTRALRAVAVVVAAVVVTAGVVVAIKWSDGAFSGQYRLSGMFTRAGEGLHSGSEVVHHGVQVGRVTGITLVDDRAKVTMAIDPSFHVPANATATVEPINVFGADQVALSYPGGDHAPRLPAGGTFAHTAVSDEVSDLFAAADPLLKKIDAPDLSTVVDTLAKAAAGQGPTIARSVEEGAKLAAFLDKTLPSQLSALDSFAGFQNAITPTAASLNAIAAAGNKALPAFNAHATQYAALLKDLAPFAHDLAQLLAAYHPNFLTLLDSGDNVARVVLARQNDIGKALSGLAVYLTKFANSIDPAEKLPDGSTFAYFQTFVLFGDVNQLVCSLLAPAAPGLSFLEPLQQALSGAGTPLNCSSQIAAFDAAQHTSASGPASTASPTQATAKAAKQLSTQLYQQLGAPQAPAPTGGDPLSQILGGLLG